MLSRQQAERVSGSSRVISRLLRGAGRVFVVFVGSVWTVPRRHRRISGSDPARWSCRRHQGGPPAVVPARTAGRGAGTARRPERAASAWSAAGPQAAGQQTRAARGMTPPARRGSARSRAPNPPSEYFIGRLHPLRVFMTSFCAWEPGTTSIDVPNLYLAPMQPQPSSLFSRHHPLTASLLRADGVAAKKPCRAGRARDECRPSV